MRGLLRVVLRVVCDVSPLACVHFTTEEGYNVMLDRTHHGRRTTSRAALWALGATGVGLAAYLGVSAYAARRLAFSKPLAIEQTPADFGLDFRDVSFLGRDDGILLRGWLIPGI